jgi:hypothetical protein
LKEHAWKKGDAARLVCDAQERGGRPSGIDVGVSDLSAHQSDVMRRHP